jgi:hypothetical protein
MIIQGTGTQLAIVGTEIVLVDLTLAAAFVALMDMTAMEAGDSVELRSYAAAISGGPPLCAYYQIFSGPQPNNGGQLSVSLPVPSLFEYKFSLKQILGTGRSFPWTVLSL